MNEAFSHFCPKVIYSALNISSLTFPGEFLCFPLNLRTIVTFPKWIAQPISCGIVCLEMSVI